MSKGKLMVRAAGMALLAFVAFGGSHSATAQGQNDFIGALDNGLKKPGQTRSLKGGGLRTIRVEEKVEDVGKKLEEGQQLTPEDRKEIAKVIEKPELKKVDIAVFFAYNSDQILPQAIPTLVKLGQALKDERLEGQTFLINGHTDAAGGPGYNLVLSQRRAESVKGFLVQTFQIDPKRLVAVGFGFESLKNPRDPFAAENRRVEIVNASR